MTPTDRAAAIPLAIMLIFVIAVWLGIFGPVVDDISAKGIYEIFKDWQTLISAIIALVAALVAARPVWRQLREMRAQSATQTYEVLRQQMQTVEEDRRLALEAQRLAYRCKSLEEVIANNKGLETPDLLPRFIQYSADHLEGVDKLEVTLELAGVRRWGSADAQRARSNLEYKLLQLRGGVLLMKHAFENAHLQRSFSDFLWITEKEKLYALSVAQEQEAVQNAAKEFLIHVDAERERLRAPMDCALNAVIQSDN